MTLKTLTKDDYKNWDNFVDISPQGSLFSKTWYLDALQVRYEILVVEEKENIKAGIVLAKNEINTFANPMLDKYLGILCSPGSTNKHKRDSTQYKSMDILARKLKNIKSFDYYFHPTFENWIPLYWHNFTQQTRYTYRINNSQALDTISNNMHKNIIKANIKNAEKNGITIKQDIPFDTLWELVNKTFLRQGSKSPFNKKKLEYYVTTLKEKGTFVSFGAYDTNDRCVAAGGVIYEEKSAYFLLNGIDIENMTRGANTLLIYEAIKYFHDKCDYFDFEGSMLPGVEPLYRKFGGELTPYMRIWNDNFFNYAKTKAKKIYKKIRYGR